MFDSQVSQCNIHVKLLNIYKNWRYNKFINFINGGGLWLYRYKMALEIKLSVSILMRNTHTNTTTKIMAGNSNELNVHTNISKEYVFKSL